MRKLPRAKRTEPRFYCFDPGDERYNPTMSYFQGSRVLNKLQADILPPEGYDPAFIMPPDWPGNEPVWAAVCTVCPWRYEGPQSKAIPKFIKHATPYEGFAQRLIEHRLHYIHLGTCWHEFNVKEPLEYIHCQNHALEMIRQAGISLRKRQAFNDAKQEEVRQKLEKSGVDALTWADTVAQKMKNVHHKHGPDSVGTCMRRAIDAMEHL